MADLEFINPNNHPIQIAGPSKEIIKFKKFEKRVLSSWFTRYCPRYLTVVDVSKTTKRINPRSAHKPDNVKHAKKRIATENKKKKRRDKLRTVVRKSKGSGKIHLNRKTVGRKDFRHSKDATKHYKRLLELVQFPISNDIGVGILSYNRLNCIRRLVESIRRHTDLNKTTVFVSDESDDKKVKDWLRKQGDIVVIDNTERLGIAGNSNRLLRCLERFEYKLLLNDDVEILNAGWDNLYPALMEETKYHHFCMRQSGIHGASNVEGKITKLDKVEIQTINQKPHGAVIAFDSLAFEKVGYLMRILACMGWSMLIGLIESH